MEENIKQRGGTGKKGLIVLIVLLVFCLLAAAANILYMMYMQQEDAGVYTKNIIYSKDNPIPQIAERVRPAVVQIVTQKEMWSAEYGVWAEPMGSGSGVYIDERGYIVTNYHVVDGADIVTVHLLDGTEIEVEEVLSDEATDLALLKIASGLEGVQPVPMGDSDALTVGELAIVIGNPGALSDTYPGTVTAGIISGLERENVNAGNFSRAVNVIQMDAAINGGNSGGARPDFSGNMPSGGGFPGGGSFPGGFGG